MKLNEKLFATLRAATSAFAAKAAKPGAGTGSGSGPQRSPIDVTAVIQDALKVLKPGNPGTSPGPSATGVHPEAPPMRDINPPPQGRTGTPPPAPEQEAPAADGARRSGMHEAAHAFQKFNEELMSKLDLPASGAPGNFKMPAFDLGKMGNLPGMGGMGRAPAEPMPGEFIDGSFTNAAGTRTYKLYVPSTYTGQTQVPLVVMLHGCTQDPDDFASGTQMNKLAEEMQCLVVYPAQSQQANASRCWNWFSATDQKRGQGEPSIIAGITESIIRSHKVDPLQVYVAGLSAGGAMAAIMGTLYPELYAAVGVHSGLPFASAQDLPSALAAMQGSFGKPVPAGKSIPIIVFHGDKDTTVHPVNAEECIKQAAHGAKEVVSEPGRVSDGHAYTRRKHQHADGTLHAEHWTIHGAGHAWSGGSARGTYTDGKGPDASREMMRFFTTKR